MAVTSSKFSDLVRKLIADEVRQKDSARIKDAIALHRRKRRQEKVKESARSAIEETDGSIL